MAKVIIKVKESEKWKCLIELIDSSYEKLRKIVKIINIKS